MTLKTIFLTIYLMTGTRHVEPVTELECRSAIEQSRAVFTLGGLLADDEGVVVVRVSCGDENVVLALPESEMPCEVTSKRAMVEEMDRRDIERRLRAGIALQGCCDMGLIKHE